MPFFSRDRKLNMVVFSNCHGERYIEMFKRDTAIKEMFSIEYVVSYQQLDNFDKYQNMFSTADVLIVNNIKSYSEYTVDNLRKILKKESLLIVIPFVRFEGYWLPEAYKHLRYFQDNAVKMFPDISSADVLQYLRGPVDAEELGVHYSACLAKLEAIERESDILFYEFFVKNHRKYPMFRDNYHPTKNMLEHVGASLMRIIDDRFDVQYEGRPRLQSETIEYGHYKPVKDNVKKILGLEYDLDKVYVCSRQEYLERILEYESQVNDPVDDLIDMQGKVLGSIFQCH